MAENILKSYFIHYILNSSPHSSTNNVYMWLIWDFQDQRQQLFYSLLTYIVPCLTRKTRPQLKKQNSYGCYLTVYVSSTQSVALRSTALALLEFILKLSSRVLHRLIKSEYTQFGTMHICFNNLQVICTVVKV